MILLKSATVYNPNKIGTKDLLIGAKKILHIDSKIDPFLNAEIFDATNKIIIPGLLDQHIHITGGGGEGGFQTRVPETMLSDFIEAGITTAVGLLGTDSTTRSVENLVAKAKALTKEGITVFALTGAYAYPSPTLTGFIEKDIAFINEIIGTKIAANDHRDSAITAEELAKIGSAARIGGMLSEKSGHVTVHMGSGQFDLSIIKQALETSNLPITAFRPTHVNRKKSLCLDALKFAFKGGYIDITCSIPSEMSDEEILRTAVERKVPLEHLTFSSDGFGSWSSYDAEGNLIEIGVTPINSLLPTIRNLAPHPFKLEDILPLFTSNVANQLKISDYKGYIKENYDADLLILDNNLNLEGVIAKGKWLMKDKKIVRFGTYEKSRL